MRQGTIEVHIIRRFAHNLTDLPNPALCALVADSHRWQELKRAVLDLGIRKGESGHACGVWRFAVGATEGYDGFARLQVLARNGVPLEGSA